MNIAQQQLLYNIKQHLKSGSELIPVPHNSFFFLTKGDTGISEGYFFRDLALEKRTNDKIFGPHFKQITARYKQFDALYTFQERPKHYPVKLHLMNGVISQGENIFMFFPQALGIDSSQNDDFFGFEFIDIWSKIFLHIIFPCIERTFTPDTCKQIKGIINDSIEDVVYIASVWHEFGHHIGPWRVFPSQDQKVRISKFQADILGELATDALLMQNLVEYKEVILCVLLQRLFWYGRNGFDHDNHRANINNDNDCWIGAYLWNKYTQSECLRLTTNGWEADISSLPQILAGVTNEINHLAVQLKSSTNADYHATIVNKWMQANVEYQEGVGYLLSDSWRRVLLKCDDIPYNAALYA